MQLWGQAAGAGPGIAGREQISEQILRDVFARFVIHYEVHRGINDPLGESAPRQEACIRSWYPSPTGPSSTAKALCSSGHHFPYPDIEIGMLKLPHGAPNCPGPCGAIILLARELASNWWEIGKYVMHCGRTTRSHAKTPRYREV